jgi:glycine oxidase
MLGPTSLPGLVIATGHYRNGILLAPVTADAVAELLASGELPADFTRFDPRRFAVSEVPA